jgi:hypothetical protein
VGLAGAPPWAAVGRLLSTSVRVRVPTAKGPRAAEWAGATVGAAAVDDEVPLDPEPHEARATATTRAAPTTVP